MARVAHRCMMEALDHSRAAQITLTTDAGERPSIALPPAALKFIGQLLGAMSEGRQIILVPADREFTTVEAANFLNVSRPFVIKEIEAGRLKHRMVGTHRRIALDDLVAYARQMREKQMSLATAGLFAAKWTQRIELEWITNLEALRSTLKDVGPSLASSVPRLALIFRCRT